MMKLRELKNQVYIVRTFTSICFITIIVFGCRNKADQQLTVTPTKITISNEIIPSEDVIELADVVKLESSDVSKVGGFTKLVAYDNHYYLLDDKFNKTVLQFGSDGRFLNSYGGIGQGPGEYTRSRWFSVCGFNSELAIFEASRRRLLVYNLQTAEFIDDIPLNFQAQSFEFIPTGGYIFYTSFSYLKDLVKAKIRLKSETSYQIITTNESGEIIGFDLPYSSSYKSQNFTTNWSVFSPYCDKLSFFSQYVDTLFSVDPSGTIIPEFTIDYGNNNQELSTKYCNDVGPNPVIDFQRNSALRKTSGIFRLLNQYQTNKHIHLVGLYNSSVYRFLIDKKSGNVVDLQKHNELVHGLGFRTSDCIYFYSLVFASVFKKDENGDVSGIYSQKLRTIINSSLEEDNPILLAWRVLDF